MNVEAFVHGIYPRTEPLITVSRGFDRGRATAEELAQLQQKDQLNLVQLQKSEGFSYVEDGKITWQDIFRPIVTSTSGLSVGSITRWFGNNTFFKQPIITGPLVPDFTQLDPYISEIEHHARWKVTIPSPYTFAKLAKDTTTDKFYETLEHVTELTRAIIMHLEDRGVAMIQLNEPWLPYPDPYIKKTSRDLDDLVSSLRALDRKNRKAKLGIHFFFGNAAPMVHRIELENVVDAIGVDFISTNVDDLPSPLTHDLIAGVVDGKDSRIEGKEAVQHSVERIIAHMDPDTMFLAPNCDLEFLPEPIARKKIALLGSLQKDNYE